MKEPWKEQHSIEIYHATKSFNIFSPPSSLEASVGAGNCFDFAEIRPSKNVTSGRVTHPAAASFALLLRNFGGISVSFVLPDNDSAGGRGDPKAGAATLSPPLNGEFQLLLV